MKKAHTSVAKFTVLCATLILLTTFLAWVHATYGIGWAVLALLPFVGTVKYWIKY